ncbi:hypothetical protein U3516DRAFT_189779 [Neocallimastix sp. 'constans']
MSLILTACYFNKLSIIKYLITNNKADINTKNNNNDTLLIISVYFNNEKIIKYLIENKADFHLKNKNGYNVRTIVRNLKLEKIEKYFEKLDYLKIKNESLNDFKNNNNDRDDNNSDSDSIISSKITDNFKEEVLNHNKCTNQSVIVKDYISLKINDINNLNLDSYISIGTNEKLLNVSKKSICRIEILNEETNKHEIGTGFFIKLLIPSEKTPLYGLMTNNHVVNADFIEKNKSLKIYLNQNYTKKKKNSKHSANSEDVKPYEIKLDKKYFIFTSELIDVTFIELPKKYINNSEFKFLDSFNDIFDEEEEIYVFQYPKGKLSFHNGFVRYSTSFNYFHSASTYGGSSGSPILNKYIEVIGVHKSNWEVVNRGNYNVAVKFNIIKNAINRLYYKRYINDIKKARETPRKLSDDEEKELKKHGLMKIKIEKLPYLYKCPYLTIPSMLMLFLRTNNGWYFTIKKEDEMDVENIYPAINTYNWILIDPYKRFEEIMNEFDNEIKNIIMDEFEEKIEHRHELIISWLKSSELMYI